MMLNFPRSAKLKKKTPYSACKAVEHNERQPKWLDDCATIKTVLSRS